MGAVYSVMPAKRSYGRVQDRECEHCRKTFHPLKRSAVARFCSRSCQFAGNRGERSPNWRGGRNRSNGYVLVHRPDHPAAHWNGYVLEHRLVVEQAIGRMLSSHETVHHINGDGTDNRPENLQLRTGKHGNGIVHRCGDCGSANIIAASLAEAQE